MEEPEALLSDILTLSNVYEALKEAKNGSDKTD